MNGTVNNFAAMFVTLAALSAACSGAAEVTVGGWADAGQVALAVDAGHESPDAWTMPAPDAGQDVATSPPDVVQVDAGVDAAPDVIDAGACETGVTFGNANLSDDCKALGARVDCPSCTPFAYQCLTQFATEPTVFGDAGFETYQTINWQEPHVSCAPVNVCVRETSNDSACIAGPGGLGYSCEGTPNASCVKILAGDPHAYCCP